MRLSHTDEEEGRAILSQAEAELRRLEGIFSLFLPDSEISELNRQGELLQPSFEFVEALSTSLALSSLTDGAFDPSVQPLWNLFANHFRETGQPPAEKEIEDTVARVDWRAIEVTANKVSLRHPGMAITLNGMAQGYITDRIANLLREREMQNVLIDLGEIRPLGRHPSGRPWRVEIESAEEPLFFAGEDRAIATSSAKATSFDIDGKFHHLIDPRIGKPMSEVQSISVIANTATIADGLSTALSVMPLSRWDSALSRIDHIPIGVYATRNDGTKFQLSV